MTTSSVPLAEITSTAIGLLCREIGVANTARFLNQFTTGVGNYAEERGHFLGNPTVDELVAEIQRKRTRPKRDRKPTGPERELVYATTFAVVEVSSSLCSSNHRR